MASITKATTGKGETRYKVRVVTGYAPSGDPMQEQRTFKLKREAETWGKQRETEIERGLGGDGGKVRLAEFLAQWLERGAKRVRPSTMIDYRYQVEKRILPALGGVYLRDLKPHTLQAWIDALPTPYVAKRARRILHIALGEAEQLGLIPMNPLHRTTAPAAPAKEGQSWTPEQARTFLALARRQCYEPIWTLALRTGMRPSELRALLWTDIDLAGCTIRVQRARPNVYGQDIAAAKPKSKAGTRTIGISAPLAAYLRGQHAAQLERRMLQGPRWEEHGLVCPSTTGTPLGHANVYHRFREMCAKAGVPLIRLYDLRHSAASMMLEAGADLKATSEVLGHSDPRITQKVYQHTSRNQRDGALALLAEALEDPT